MKTGSLGASAAMFAALILISPAAPAAGKAGKAGKSSCVACHRELKAGSVWGHSFKEWENSPHARVGVECQDCHKGDSSSSDASKAHVGLVVSNNPKSPIYFTNIPAFCGGCHKGEFKEFRRSRHFSELQRTGRGPNCLTCHGAMAASIPSPTFLQATCANCHDQPLKVYEGLTSLSLARKNLARLGDLVAQADKEGVSATAEKKANEALKKKYAGVQEQWHAFKMSVVLPEIKEISGGTARSIRDLEMRLGAENGSTRGKK